jgi:hypothetical protein
MTAPSPAGEQREKQPQLALDDPAAVAFAARLLQAALERRRRRLAASKDGERDG